MKKGKIDICEECEDVKEDMWICLICIETLCEVCDGKIHNKGTRVNHHRVKSKSKLYENKSTGFKITYFMFECYKGNLFSS